MRSIGSFITRYRWPLLTAVAMALALVSGGALLAQPGGLPQRPTGPDAQQLVSGTGTVSTTCGVVGFTSNTNFVAPVTTDPTVALSTTLTLPCTGPAVATVYVVVGTGANGLVKGLVRATCLSPSGRGGGCTTGATVDSEPSTGFSSAGASFLQNSPSEVSAHPYQGLFPSLTAGTWRFDFVIFTNDAAVTFRSLVVQTYGP